MLDLDDLVVLDLQTDPQEARRVPLQDLGVDSDVSGDGIGEGPCRSRLLRDRVPARIGKPQHFHTVLAETDRLGDRGQRGVVLQIGCTISIGDMLQTGVVAGAGSRGLGASEGRQDDERYGRE